MKLKNVINLLLICWGVFVTGISLTLLTPFYPTEALSKVFRARDGSPPHSHHAGSDGDSVRGGAQHGLRGHSHLHSDIWKGTYSHFVQNIGNILNQSKSKQIDLR